MDAKIEANRIVVTGPFTPRLAALATRLEGWKKWTPNFTTEATVHNVTVMREIFPHLETPCPALPVGVGVLSRRGEYSPVYRPWPYQGAFLDKVRGKTAFALFAEMGLGKTKMTVDWITELWSTGQIDSVVIVAALGVHAQWINEAFIEHMPKEMPWTGHVWKKGKGIGKAIKPDALNAFSINFDGAKGKTGMEDAKKFIWHHKGRTLLVIDESQNVKNARSQRWKAAFEIRKECSHAIILSGTPIANNLVDYWAQYKLLDERIIGCRYETTFRSKYCRMGGFEGREIIGYKNQEELFALTEPYTYRITKKEGLDLPDKLYSERSFVMSAEQTKLFMSMKQRFIAEIDKGVIQTAAHGAVALTRLHQITSGLFVPDDEGDPIEIPGGNPRLDALMEVLEEIGDKKVIIWCRFNYDVKTVAAKLGAKAVTYYGPTSTKDRERAKEAFINNPAIQYMVSSPAAGGAGIDGYQAVCSYAIYYNNGFKAIDRWQSEDRIHRIGTHVPPTYIDLICRGGIDRKILRNLKMKQSVSNLMLDDMRRMFDEQ